MSENRKTTTLKKIDFAVAIILSAMFIGFLILSSTRAPLNFDASYNMLPYQSLSKGTGFQYIYDSKSVPFNPAVTTGPELYLPTLMIWKLIGHTDYFVATYVLIAYYAMFFAFLLFYVLKEKPYKTLSLLFFLILIFSNKQLFDNRSLIDPLGEIVSSFMVFAGAYLLYKKKTIPSFILFGLALDTKANIIIALLPALAIYIFLEYLWPIIKEKEYQTAAKTSLRWIFLSLIIFTPSLFTTRVLPELTLNTKEKIIFHEAQQDWNNHRNDRGLGQLTTFLKHPNRHTLKTFWNQTAAKIPTLKSYFNGSLFLIILFYTSLLFLISYTFRKKHFSFLLFVFSFFFSLWWLFVTTDAWWRYFLLVEWMYILGIVAIAPMLFRKQNLRNPSSLFIFLSFLIVFLPQFSTASINRSLDPSEKNYFTQMQKLIEPIDQNNLFTYGWFQCPQLMLQTGKRFQDYTDQGSVKEASQEGEPIYLLTAIENTIVQPEMDEVLKSFDLVKAFGYNGLYKLR
ncbi:MAG: hypothetical protein Q8L09_00820 [Candidatus Moranbacteria bacterium]|nr:hypothetical protein [Candidatus Moranbacteria bacterium]